MPTFGDDSGMCVDALGGEPGVYSKRWSGKTGLHGEAVDAANNGKLLARLAAERVANPSGFTDTARYICVAAYKDNVGEETSRAELEGRVLSEARGRGGFGYDPYFLVSGLGETFAEWSIEKTARSSHRSSAFRTLISSLRRQGRL
jgi:XTP/dITP diphosphohydrolase